MPSIPYVTNIPAATDKASVSQGQLQTNNNGINTWTGVDHYQFVDGNAGLHKQVTLPVQATAPTFSGTNIGLYSLVPTGNPATAVPELYLRKQDGTKVPAAALRAQTSDLTEGWTALPSGIVFKWGIGSATGSATSVAITYSTAAPFIPYAYIYSVQITPRGNFTATVRSDLPVNTTGFAVSVSGSGNRDFFWTAIGFGTY